MRKAIAIVMLLLAMIGGGVWYYVTPPVDEKAAMAEIEKMLDEAKKVNVELLAFKQKEVARLAEAEAKKPGDVARQRELAEAMTQFKAELLKHAELTKQREALAKKRADATKQRMQRLEDDNRSAERLYAHKCAPSFEKAVETKKVLAEGVAEAVRKGCG